MFSNPNIIRVQNPNRHKNGGILKVVSQTCNVQNRATSWISKANIPSEAKDTTETYKMSETSGNFIQNAECRGRLGLIIAIGVGAVVIEKLDDNI